MIVARRCYVSGRVQGVFFRATTQRQARELGLSGHALNLPDGRVEVLVRGPVDAVRALVNWLWEGPDGARVTAVECDEIEPFEQEDFRTG